MKALILVVPGLLALPAQDLAAMRSLSALARYAGSPQCEPRGIAAALFASLGVAPETAVAPLALLGAGVDPGDDYVLCADPVHLAADRDTLVLVQAVDDLSAPDADTLVRMLDRHFADDDLCFEAMRPNAWFARRRQAADIVTTPADVARGRKLIASLPRGPDSGQWKRWQNEIQMLLHEHPVNTAREAHGDLAANAIWFWGGGRLADVGAIPMSVVRAAPGRLGDLAHGIARRTGGLDAAPQAGDDLTHGLTRAAALASARRQQPIVVIDVSPRATADASPIETGWLAPALEQLTARDIDVLHLIANGNGAAATWTAKPPGVWQRIASHAAHRRLEIPAGPDI